MTDKEKLACLTDRPCQVCKHKKENGCCKWSCVFEEESESADIEKIRAEIEKDTREYVCDEFVDGLNHALEIIDRHISEKGDE